ncbi:hypothetical protein, partial [Serratia marcescens]|uniref:hypothetical protein n=1 Tax=Serratia marcescens TaxID=615 RepID=UPI001ADDEF69
HHCVRNPIQLRKTSGFLIGLAKIISPNLLAITLFAPIGCGGAPAWCNAAATPPAMLAQKEPR